jgi:hypothetical protein
MKSKVLKTIYCFALSGLVILITSCSNGNSGKGEAETSDAQNLPVTSFYLGNPNIATTSEGGVCMMGGRTENDNAMRWFLSRAQGGDVSGLVRVYGNAGEQDIAFFINEDLEVVALKGDSQGSATFNLSNWQQFKSPF